jgi:endoribonuclease Dicer
MNRFCGSMGCDLWSKSTWARHFNENMVIVCTADVLYQCLHHSFISIDRINLLIFDEAHHAKKNHAYARIIKDFYLAEGDKSKRPRLFGMTASPVDARIDPAKAAKELETLLHCQIATAKDTSLLQYGTNSKEEKITTYLPLREPYETPLYQQLKLRFAKMAIFSKALAFAKLATSELGPWCADQLWTFCLSEEEDRKLESKMERKFRARKVAEPIEVLDAQLAQLQEAQELVKSHKFRDPEPNLKDLSSKVVKLMECLRERYERPSSDKCIVFVKQRYTARLLTELFSHPNIGTPNLHVGSLVSMV